jgi:bacterioferritin-associated ferredoxin
MIVCLCHGVCDRRIRALINDGATTVEEVGKRCGAGTDCGSCQEKVGELIDEETCRRGAGSAIQLRHPHREAA